MLIAKITRSSKISLHIAVGTGNALPFVEKLLKIIPAGSLALKDRDGDTALAFAAIVGNTKAAKMLVRKNPGLPQMPNKEGKTPVCYAAQYGHKETVLYLLSVTRSDKDPFPFTGKLGVTLLNYVIVAGFYDVALQLVWLYPNLAVGEDKFGSTALDKLAEMRSAFSSGDHLPFWRSFIYTLCQKLKVVCWDAIKLLAPSLRHIHETKLMHVQMLQLVKCICDEVVRLDDSEVMKLLGSPILKAATTGIHEIITECVQSYPYSIWFWNNKRQTIYHLAVLNRRVKVFNLIYQMSSFKHIAAAIKDESGNNILHLVAKLAPSSELNSVSGAALQMQRELQWYKVMENFVQPSYKEMHNSQGKTPKMIFTEEHMGLLKEGERWMKGTTTSCMVVATLIATVVFAAAFTVPGGDNNDNGTPIFLKAKSFMVFAISDALALFSSTTSVLMFLSILTSRYAEEDFLHSLPTKLILGLTTLFFSIASMMIAFSAMMIAFSATLFIVLNQKIAWVVIPVSLVACVAVTLFALLQFPLLKNVIKSTYVRSIFHQQNKDLPY